MLTYLDSLQKTATPQIAIKEVTQKYQAFIEWLYRENKDLGFVLSSDFALQDTDKDTLLTLSSKNKSLSIHSLNLLKEQVIFYEEEILKKLGAGGGYWEIVCFEDYMKMNIPSSVITQWEYYEAEVYLGQTMRDWRNVYIRSIIVNDKHVYHEDPLSGETKWKTKGLKEGWNTWEAKINVSAYGKDTLIKLQGKYLVTETK
jgi:hypothetical protein